MIKKSIAIIIMVALCFVLISCQNKNQNIITGHDIETIQNYFPQITGIASCEWTSESISNNSRLSIGLSNYKSYGHIVLTEDYYNCIVSKYEWVIYQDESSINFISELTKNNILYYNKQYTNEISNDIFSVIILNKQNFTLYFYTEKG